MVQPIANHHLWIALGSAAIFILVLIIIEYLHLKFDWFEKLMSGRSKVVIENGQIIENNLRTMRMTVDQLEMRLRQNGVTNLSDVKTATLEPNGQIGYELMRHAKPVTIGDLERMLGLEAEQTLEQSLLFQEVKTDHHPTAIDPKLQ